MFILLSPCKTPNPSSSSLSSSFSVHTPLLPPHPAKPPTHHHHHPPAHSPTHTPRSLIAIEGVVYVKSCNHVGVDTLKGATPLLGAVVKLQCNNYKYMLVLKAKTDKKGYFYIGAPKNITSCITRHCNVVLDSASNGLKPSNLHGGFTGALLKPVKQSVSKSVSLKLYIVGPFVFEPKCHN
ncbi:non-classical arabinogalactan protein 30 [Medicago truncatula]|uniref:non-classical arabinogalactan protein 30 n=1 Tax=Medicago truncatula TaxID=3880 RepID=UPI000D2F2A15|nr:non-classical arabinogalactan protein 30 [Medicago truncatula]